VRHVNGVQEWRTIIDGVALRNVAEINLVDVKVPSGVWLELKVA
jgi:hypothetical protein